LLQAQAAIHQKTRRFGARRDGYQPQPHRVGARLEGLDRNPPATALANRSSDGPLNPRWYSLATSTQLAALRPWNAFSKFSMANATPQLLCEPAFTACL